MSFKRYWPVVILAAGLLPVMVMAQAERAKLECYVSLTSEDSGVGFVWLDKENNPSTNWWHLGAVPRGGVRDTRYNSGDPNVVGPGAFKVQNVGSPAKMLIQSSGATGGDCEPTDNLPTGQNKYALAVASNAGDPIPQWRMLYEAGYSSCMQELVPYAATGEVVPFDLKYWAPTSGTSSGNFVVEITVGVFE